MFYYSFFYYWARSQRGGWVNLLGTNDGQCFLVNLSMLIIILDVIQAKSVGISCLALSKSSPSLNLILWKLWKLLCLANLYTLSKKCICRHFMILWRARKKLLGSRKNFRTRFCKLRTTFISEVRIVCELISSESFIFDWYKACSSLERSY